MANLHVGIFFARMKNSSKFPRAFGNCRIIQPRSRSSSCDELIRNSTRVNHKTTRMQSESPNLRYNRSFDFMSAVPFREAWISINFCSIGLFCFIPRFVQHAQCHETACNVTINSLPIYLKNSLHMGQFNLCMEWTLRKDSLW